MIEKHDTWHRGWMFFAIFLCLAVSATALIRVQRVEAKTTETEKSESSPQKTQGDSEEREGDSFGDLTWLKVSGKIVAPEKIAFDKFDIKAVGHSVLNPNRSGSGDTRVDEDGTFSGDIWADYDYGFFFNDPNLQWAAKPVFMTVGKESPKEKVVITLEKGSLVEATLLDRETGKPISGMTVWLTQDIEWKDSRSAHKTFSNSELLRTDENGQIKCCVTPGDFRFTVDMPNFSWEDGERLYSLDFTVKKGENAKPLLKIPPPFLGKVLDENGEPVVDARVAVHGPTMDFLYTDTDKDGFFKRRTAPKSSLIEIVKRKGKNKETTFVGWVKDELKNDEIWTVTLREGETVTGRLLDAATGKPLAKSLLFYQYENPKNSKQKEFLASSARTDAEGYFKATGLNPGLNYRFFFVPGRTREYNGGPYSPRVELAFLKTDKPGETVDLGDLKVDPNQAESDPQDELADEFSKRIEEGFSDLLTGKKKGGFILIAASDDDKAVEQILSYRNDLRFGSLVFFTVKRSEIPEQFLGQLDERDGRYPLLFAVGNPKRESPPTPVFLDELRGEKDSSWNVPNDDPSNSGDWKKTPGMVNPKIFDNFLNDYLKKID